MTEPSAGYGDPLTGPFWAGAEAGELRLPRCSGCGLFAWYPRPFCLSCGADDFAWVAVSGSGTIHSQVVVRVAVTPELEPPYVVALVDLDEGPRFLAGIVASIGATAIGDRVRLCWRERPGSPPLPMFEPLPSGDAARSDPRSSAGQTG